MTSRQAFQAIMACRPAARMPLLVIDPYESMTVDLWRAAGHVPAGVSPSDVLRMDPFAPVWLNLGPIPVFERRRLSENAHEYIETTEMGCTVRSLKEAPGMYYGHVDHPVKTSDDWQRYRERLDAVTPGRLWPELEAFVARVNASETPTCLTLYPWFFRYGFYLMGMERFLLAFYDQPALIHDIFGHLSRMTRDLIRPLLPRVRFDCACFAEDLAFCTAPHISPEIYRDFWLPHQDPVTAELKAAGIPVISLYTSGNCEALLPLAMQHGINATWPCERNAGMDPLHLRRKFGPDLRLIGGVGHTCLTRGRAAIDAEVRRLRPLIEEGGFIPMLDDMIPPEVDYESYAYCVEALRAMSR